MSISLGRTDCGLSIKADQSFHFLTRRLASLPRSVKISHAAPSIWPTSTSCEFWGISDCSLLTRAFLGPCRLVDPLFSFAYQLQPALWRLIACLSSAHFHLYGSFNLALALSLPWLPASQCTWAQLAAEAELNLSSLGSWSWH